MICCDRAQARLKEIRLARGWSESDLGSRLGINTAWYYDMELCEDGLFTELNLSQFFQLCRILGVLPVELLSGNTSFNPTAQGLPYHIKIVQTKETPKDILAKLNETAWEVIISDNFFTSSELFDYFEITDLLQLDWTGVLMADHQHWLQAQPLDRCHWPDYYAYPNLSASDS